ncbi:Serine hydroxymethyltransferase 2 [compost metagenome]
MIARHIGHPTRTIEDRTMFSKHDRLTGYDDELLAAMNAEEARQEQHIELIDSEN